MDMAYWPQNFSVRLRTLKELEEGLSHNFMTGTCMDEHCRALRPRIKTNQPFIKFLKEWAPSFKINTEIKYVA
jgi:hypothetical protein